MFRVARRPVVYAKYRIISTASLIVPTQASGTLNYIV